MPRGPRPATARQLHVCREIAKRTGRTFVEPLTFEAAHRIISRARAAGRYRNTRAELEPRPV